MTTSTTDIAPLAWRPVAVITAIVGVLQLGAAIAGRGYWFDEVYMLAIGRSHLDWGSADQPPLTPALAALSDTLFENSVVALRIPAILATMGTIMVAALITREMGGDGRAQTLVAAAQASAPWAAVSGHWLTPYALEPVGWLLLVWLLVRWIRVRDDRLVLALGVVAGLAAMTKFQVVFFCAIMLTGVATVGPRALLRRPLLWAGAAVGLLICAPTLWWQAQHGWPQLKMAEVVAAEAEPLYGGRASIAVLLFVFAGPAAAGLALYGLLSLVRDRALRDYRFLGVTFVALYAAFAATGGRPYYLCGLFGALAAVGALSLQRRREAGLTRWRWAVWPVYLISAALALGGLYLGVDLTRSDDGERIVQRTAEVYRSLPAEQRGRTALIGESYIVAAYIDAYSTEYDLPAAFSPARSYGYFPAPGPEIDTVLVIGDNRPDRLRPYFTESRKIDGPEDQIDVWLMSGPTEGWDTLWPKMRTLEVV
ncbi:glycosyl transferase family 39 [Mycolicibacterium chitae]|uniref:Glycosyl transferase, family 39 n=1 Tax=Mycolicibacterium chitae TaxID=1792 RepID=A0A3S4S915_MYCCI|nr:glycosyltransferase family 39 protein [Mycolicibacterium chitae]BBZ04103.1 glycosyl transferase family 39 [Mycolicibacterium chitae]VEG47754.1 glycosyl transferase, family 39 [Mycolicibacterium chitae]